MTICAYLRNCKAKKVTPALQYNEAMSDFRVYTPVQVRFCDIDSMRHVNNATYLSYLEMARLEYLVGLGIWDGKDYAALGLIVADIHIAYRAPIMLTDAVRVGIRTSHIGIKSLRFDYVIENPETGKVFATAESVLVAFDYTRQASIPVPAEWRAKISAFDGLN
jgi:acyl-CoA thioester hydrolase